MVNYAAANALGIVMLLSSHAPNTTLKHGTAIAAIRIPAEIVIAADSRVVDDSLCRS
jgi:hypothetical protein